MRGVDFSRVNSARKFIKPLVSGKYTSLWKTYGIGSKSNRASRLLSIPDYANGFDAIGQPYDIFTK
jgi:hypothetical protein